MKITFFFCINQRKRTNGMSTYFKDNFSPGLYTWAGKSNSTCLNTVEAENLVAGHSTKLNACLSNSYVVLMAWRILAQPLVFSLC